MAINFAKILEKLWPIEKFINNLIARKRKSMLLFIRI
jgi:hypothetical protein